MEIKLHNVRGIVIGEVFAEGAVFGSAGQILDLMAECMYLGSTGIILHEQNLVGAFFDLKTRLAGEILQKFSNYRMKAAIVGDFSKFTSKSLQDFIRESNRMGRIFFVCSLEEALEKLTY
jgi:hypothetical protein